MGGCPPRWALQVRCNIAGAFWHQAGLCYFEPGELDSSRAFDSITSNPSIEARFAICRDTSLRVELVVTDRLPHKPVRAGLQHAVRPPAPKRVALTRLVKLKAISGISECCVRYSGAGSSSRMPFCPRSSVRSERHRAKVEVAGAIPAVDAILPLYLSSYKSSFVNSYSSVQVRPGLHFMVIMM